jgi:hypothetical protein
LAGAGAALGRLTTRASAAGFASADFITSGGLAMPACGACGAGVVHPLAATATSNSGIGIKAARISQFEEIA